MACSAAITHRLPTRPANSDGRASLLGRPGFLAILPPLYGMSQLMQLPPRRSTFSELPARPFPPYFRTLGRSSAPSESRLFRGLLPTSSLDAVEVLPHQIPELLLRFLHFLVGAAEGWPAHRQTAASPVLRSPGARRRRRVDGVARRRRWTPVLVAAGRHPGVWAALCLVCQGVGVGCSRVGARCDAAFVMLGQPPLVAV